MKLTWLIVMCTTGAVLPAQPPFADAPQVEIHGFVKRTDLTPGMPVLEVQTSKGIETVVLGSIRFLVERNFNPKPGVEVIVKGFASGGKIYARTVQIPSEKKVLELRDAQGYPLWRGRMQKKKGAGSAPAPLGFGILGF